MKETALSRTQFTLGGDQPIIRASEGTSWPIKIIWPAHTEDGLDIPELILLGMSWSGAEALKNSLEFMIQAHKKEEL